MKGILLAVSLIVLFNIIDELVEETDPSTESEVSSRDQSLVEEKEEEALADEADEKKLSREELFERLLKDSGLYADPERDSVTVEEPEEVIEPLSPDKEILIQAMIHVESSGNDNAVGDRALRYRAYGPLQVRQVAVDDINRRFGTNYRARQALGDRELSVELFRRYMEIYATEEHLGKQPSFECMARIWNGGPNGCSKWNTRRYWNRVEARMRYLDTTRIARHP